MQNGSILLPLENMKKKSPYLAACMRAIYINKKELVEGWNSLEDVGDRINIGITKKDCIEELITVDMETLKDKTCPADLEWFCSFVTVSFRSSWFALLVFGIL